ncbi:MAG: hypothetical protein MH252_11245 [Thermosynechococcaceae cyanobacterium MS004]|nr:hypothetical protein [Thermosynechococcaceae cyanobacterium MS004]
MLTFLEYRWVKSGDRRKSETLMPYNHRKTISSLWNYRGSQKSPIYDN